MGMTDYTTLNAILDEILVGVPLLVEGSTFILHPFEEEDGKYVENYCHAKGWECRYFPVREKFWDAVEEHTETVHRFYLCRLGGDGNYTEGHK